MCTVVIRVPATPGESTRLIAVRDEDPNRPWNPLGAWWPKSHPDLIGVQDIRAGGAWLAASPSAGRLAVLLNVGPPIPQPGLTSRGLVVLDAASGTPAPADRRTAPYVLLTVAGSRTQLEISDEHGVHHEALAPGVHMLANSKVVDDPGTARVSRWLAAFREATPPQGEPDWFNPWLGVLRRSLHVPATSDQAIVRDNRPYGIPTLSLLMCTATVGEGEAVVDYVAFDGPGRWDGRFPFSGDTG